MKRMQVVAIGITLLLPLSVPPADAQSGGGGTVISDAKIEPGDSPLVRAAKATAAWRTTLKVHAPTVIDNNTLITSVGHFAEANEPSTGLPSVPRPTASGIYSQSTRSPQNNGLFIQLQPSYELTPAPAVGGHLPPGQTSTVTTVSASPIGTPVQASNQLTSAPPAGQLSQAQTTIPTITPASPSLTPPTLRPPLY